MHHSIGLRLKQERLRLGFSQEVCAAIAQLKTFYSLSCWECEKGYPTVDALRLWGESGMDIHFILTGSFYEICHKNEYLSMLIKFIRQLNHQQRSRLECLFLSQTQLSSDEEQNFSTLGQRLQQERMRLNFNKQQLAQYAQITYKTVSFWEEDRYPPNLKALLSWQKIGLDLGFVITGRIENPWACSYVRQLIKNWPTMQPTLNDLMDRVVQPLSET